MEVRTNSGELRHGLFNAVMMNLEKEKCLLTAMTDITEKRRVIKLLQESEDKFNKAFQSNPVMTAISTVEDGRFLDVNDMFLNTLSFERDEVVGKTSLELGLFANPLQRQAITQMTKENGNARNIEVQMATKHGQLIDGLFSAEPIVFNNINCWLTVMVDITNQKRAESELRESEEKYRLLFNSSGDAIFIHDEEERILAVNQQACEQFGYTHAELISMTINQMDSPTDIQYIKERIVHVIKDGSFMFEILHLRKDGLPLPHEVNSRRIIWDGKPAIMSICRDITERKLAEAELRESEEKFRLLFNCGSDYMAVHVTGKDGQPGKFIQVNDAACKILGYTREEMLKLSPEDIDSAKGSGLMPALIEKLIKNKNILFETEMITNNGDTIPMEVSLTLFQLQEDKATICVARDLTERKLVEEALIKSEEKYRNLATASLDAIITEDLNGIITFANPAAKNLAGVLDFVGRPVKDFIPQELIIKYNEMMEARRNGYLENISYEWSMITPKDGSTKVFDIRSTVLTDKSKPSEILIVARDITERKRAEEELAKSAEKYRVIAENMLDSIFLIDTNGVFQYATNYKDPLGYELEDLLGITGMSITHPDELERIQRIYEGGVDGVWQEITYETRLRHKNGHYVPMEIRGRTFADSSGKITGAVFAGREIIQDQQKKQKRRTAKKSALTHPDLNAREKEILNWVMQGKSTWDIAMIINIGEATVKYHIDKIMKKLSAVNRTHAVAIAMQNELLN